MKHRSTTPSIANTSNILTFLFSLLIFYLNFGFFDFLLYFISCTCYKLLNITLMKALLALAACPIFNIEISYVDYWANKMLACLLESTAYNTQHPQSSANPIPDTRAFKSEDLSQTVYRTLRDADWRKRNAEMTGLSEVPSTNDRAFC